MSLAASVVPRALEAVAPYRPAAGREVDLGAVPEVVPGVPMAALGVARAADRGDDQAAGVAVHQAGTPGCPTPASSRHPPAHHSQGSQRS